MLVAILKASIPWYELTIVGLHLGELSRSIKTELHIFPSTT
mgnify:FL=1